MKHMNKAVCQYVLENMICQIEFIGPGFKP